MIRGAHGKTVRVTVLSKPAMKPQKTVELFMKPQKTAKRVTVELFIKPAMKPTLAR